MNIYILVEGTFYMDQTLINVMICGSRTITDSDWVFNQAEEYLREIYQETNQVCFRIIEGGARGVDQIAEAFAVSHNCACKEYPADWNKYGRAAGPIRNEQMVKDCDYCLILWDGSSRGTKNDIDLCERYGKKHKVVIKNSN